MFQLFLKHLLLVAFVNMSLCVPQFDLVPIHGVEKVVNSIETDDGEVVESIAALICESIFNLDIPFPIHQDAHYVEKDCVIKRTLKYTQTVAYTPHTVIAFVNVLIKAVFQDTTERILQPKYSRFIALLHYF